MKALFAALIAASLLQAVPPQLWERQVQSVKGVTFDAPPAHPLAYFTRDAFLRDDANGYCTNCKPAGKALVHTQHAFKTKLESVGTVENFHVYDLFYYFDGAEEIGWKSILIKLGQNQFREIYHLQTEFNNVLVNPSYLITLGDTKILATRNSIDGTGNFFYESYWWFNADGPMRINTDDVVSHTLKQILPPGYEVRKGGALNMQRLVFQSDVWKKDDPNAGPTGGHVLVRFKLEEGRLLVFKKVYTRH